MCVAFCLLQAGESRLGPLHGGECQGPSTKPLRGVCSSGFNFPVHGSRECGPHTDSKFPGPETGQKLTLRCAQDMNHSNMSWSRQDLGRGPALIYYSVGDGVTEKGEVSYGYSVSRPSTTNFPSHWSRCPLPDTCVPLCQPRTTALHGPRLSEHKAGGGPAPTLRALGNPCTVSPHCLSLQGTLLCAEAHLQGGVCQAQTEPGPQAHTSALWMSVCLSSTAVQLAVKVHPQLLFSHHLPK